MGDIKCGQVRKIIDVSLYGALSFLAATTAEEVHMSLRLSVHYHSLIS